MVALVEVTAEMFAAPQRSSTWLGGEEVEVKIFFEGVRRDVD